MPGIRLHDPIVSDRLTIVDLLAHRSVTAEFEVDEGGAVTRLVAQPLGVFYPKR